MGLLFLVRDIVEGVVGDRGRQMLLEVIIIDDLGDSLSILVIGTRAFSVHEFRVFFDPVRDVSVFGHHALCLVRLLCNSLQAGSLAHQF